MPGRIAARTMAWQRRLGGRSGPISAGSGEASNGEPVQVELLINGVWTDITAYVMVRDNSGNIAITRGMRDEGSQTDHATLRLLLDNRDGRFSPRNPVGTYFGLIGRNQPIRVSVPNGIGGKAYRFWGEVSAWPQMWDPTGTDVWVELEASGILRRLSQGPASENSLTYRAINVPALSGLRAYWPCEDASGATQIASALVNGSSMRFIDESPELAASALFGGSFPLPVFTSAAMRGGVAKYSFTPSATQVRFLLYVPPEGAAADLDRVVRVSQQEDISVTTITQYELFYNAPGGAYDGVAPAGSLSLESKGADGTTFGAIIHHGMDVRGKLLRFSLELQESGANVSCTLRSLNLVTGEETSVSQAMVGVQLTCCTAVSPFISTFTPPNVDTAVGLPGGVIGHITVQDTITDIEDLGISLDPAGEAAGRRVQRLCAEEGTAFDGVGDLDATVAMGGQEKVNPLALMQECEAADGGMLHENLAVLGLVYRTRESLENQDPQVTLDYSGFNLSEIPLPVEDDRYIQNKITVTVKEVSATYSLDDGSVLSVSQPPAGVGVYGTDLTLNLYDTAEAADHAAWRVHLGTVNEARHPSISVNLAHSSFTTNPLLKQAVLRLRQGDRIQVTNPPAWLPPDAIDQIILGFDEEITHFEHRITFTCAPALPYSSIGFLDDGEARLDTAGSQLAAAVTSSATSLSVTTTSGPVWVQYGRLNSNSDFETDLSGWTGSGATLARVATPGTPSFDGLWSLRITPDGVSEFPNAGSDLIATTVGQEYVLEGWLYCVTSRTVALNINWYDSGESYLSTSSNDAAVTANTWTWFTLTATAPGGSAFANLAPTVPSFPPASDVLYADEIVFRRSDEVAMPDEFPFNIRVGGEVVTVTSISGGTSPQTFAVTRSVNGVVKAHSAGADVRLARPWILAL